MSLIVLSNRLLIFPLLLLGILAGCAAAKSKEDDQVTVSIVEFQVEVDECKVASIARL